MSFASVSTGLSPYGKIQLAGNTFPSELNPSLLGSLLPPLTTSVNADTLLLEPPPKYLLNLSVVGVISFILTKGPDNPESKFPATCDVYN